MTDHEKLLCTLFGRDDHRSGHLDARRRTVRELTPLELMAVLRRRPARRAALTAASAGSEPTR